MSPQERISDSLQTLPGEFLQRSLSGALSGKRGRVETIALAGSSCKRTSSGRVVLSMTETGDKAPEDIAFQQDVKSLREAASAAVAESLGRENAKTGAGVDESEQNSATGGPSSENTRSKPAPTAAPDAGDGPEGSNSSELTSANLDRIVGTSKSAAVDQRKSSEGQRSRPRVRAANACPPHGAKAICGRRPRMEDAYTAVPFLLNLPVPAVATLAQLEILPARIAGPLVQGGEALYAENAPAGEDYRADTTVGTSLRALSRGGSAQPVIAKVTETGSTATPAGAGDSTAGEGSTSQAQSPAPDSGAQATDEPVPFIETLHFFGVFDGHGGAEAALHCAQKLHQRIAEALAYAAKIGLLSAAEVSAAQPGPPATTGGVTAGTRVVLPGHEKPESKTAQAPSDLSDSGSSGTEDILDVAMKEEQEDPDVPLSGSALEGVALTVERIQTAFSDAFLRTDEEFAAVDNAALVGTTAVAALVGSRQLYIANCGDSRAVLSRGGVAMPLTDDHKAAREDETARVEAAGGQILFWNGVRVMGVLAVSRAIGDHCLRPFVIAQPEVTIVTRRTDDELLLLASDGLWDVLSNAEACTLAKRCLRRARQRGASRQSSARIAATVLTRAAVDRGSRDNVTVVVVDLSQPQAPLPSGVPDQPASVTDDGNTSDEDMVNSGLTSPQAPAGTD